MWTHYSKKNPVPAAVYQEIFKLLCEAIPDKKRRDSAAQRSLVLHSSYNLYVWQDNGVVAVMATWEYPNIRFIEHFVVAAGARGKGLGTQMLNDYLKKSEIPVVLETELAESSAMAARRLAFYKRNGFLESSIAYQQPPLQKGAHWLSMELMSWPQKVDGEEFMTVCKLLYREVYGLSSFSIAEACSYAQE